MGLFHHGHSHGHDHEHDHAGHSHVHGQASDSLKKALLLTVIFMAVEIVGGIYANSLALISDGVHMAMDSLSLVVSIFALWLSQRPARKSYTYGYQRAEILGALVNGLAIWLISGFLIFESLQRFQSPPDVRGNWVMGIGAVGLVANLISLALLHGAQKESLNARSAYLHILTDCMGSVAAILAGAVIQFTGWRLADPLITCVFSGLMLWGSWRLVREAVDVLMERSPVGIDLTQVEAKLRALAGVESLHDLHVWTLSSGSLALSVHLEGAGDGILKAANSLLSTEFRITHTTIQVDSSPDLECQDCSHD